MSEQVDQSRVIGDVQALMIKYNDHRRNAEFYEKENVALKRKCEELQRQLQIQSTDLANITKERNKIQRKHEIAQRKIQRREKKLKKLDHKFDHKLEKGIRLEKEKYVELKTRAEKSESELKDKKLSLHNVIDELQASKQTISEKETEIEALKKQTNASAETESLLLEARLNYLNQEAELKQLNTLLEQKECVISDLQHRVVVLAPVANANKKLLKRLKRRDKSLKRNKKALKKIEKVRQEKQNDLLKACKILAEQDSMIVSASNKLQMLKQTSQIEKLELNNVLVKTKSEIDHIQEDNAKLLEFVQKIMQTCGYVKQEKVSSATELDHLFGYVYNKLSLIAKFESTMNQISEMRSRSTNAATPRETQRSGTTFPVTEAVPGNEIRNA